MTAQIDPGDGYRLLVDNVDFFEPYDEVEGPDSKIWGPISFRYLGVRYCSVRHNPARRKLPAPVVEETIDRDEEKRSISESLGKMSDAEIRETFGGGQKVTPPDPIDELAREIYIALITKDADEGYPWESQAKRAFQSANVFYAVKAEREKNGIN